MSLPLRVILAAGLLVAGAATAIATVAVHGHPWGLLLGLSATLATTLALPRGWWSRLPFVLGWSSVVGYASTSRPEGDYVVAADPAGYALLVAAFVLVVLGVVTLPRPGRARDSRGTGT